MIIRNVFLDEPILSNIDYAQLARLGIQEVKQTKQVSEAKVIQANATENGNN